MLLLLTTSPVGAVDHKLLSIDDVLPPSVLPPTSRDKLLSLKIRKNAPAQSSSLSMVSRNGATCGGSRCEEIYIVSDSCDADVEIGREIQVTE